MKNSKSTIISLLALPFLGWFSHLAIAKLYELIDWSWGAVTIPLWIAIALVIISMMMVRVHRLVIKAYMGPLAATFFIVLFILMMNFSLTPAFLKDLKIRIASSAVDLMKKAQDTLQVL